MMELDTPAEERRLKAVDGVDPPEILKVCLDGRKALNNARWRLGAVETNVMAADSRESGEQDRKLPVDQEPEGEKRMTFMEWSTDFQELFGKPLRLN